MEPKTAELFKACEILFGREVDVSRDFLDYIQPSGIKSAFRRKAMMTHPDTAVSRGLFDSDSGGTDDFIETHRAYERLLSFIKARDTRPRRAVRAPRPQEAAPQKSAYASTASASGGTTARGARAARMKRRTRHWTQDSGGRPTGNYYKGKLPPRPMLFGEYLFYSGLVPWEALIKALVWQRSQRPKFGAIAQKWGWMTRGQVDSAILNRKLGEPLGESAYRLRFLSRAQLGALVTYQRRLQQPLGEFFVLNGYLARHRMETVHRGFEEHNESHCR